MGGELNPETTVLRHEELYQGKVIDLEVDTVRLPSGQSVIREVVKHPGGVVAVPILEDGRLLLIRQFRYPLQKYILEFPAGKLDSGQSPMETMKRARGGDWIPGCDHAIRILIPHFARILQ